MAVVFQDRRCSAMATPMAMSNPPGQQYLREPVAVARPRRGGSTTARSDDREEAVRDCAGPVKGEGMKAAQLYDGGTALRQQGCGATPAAQPSVRAAARLRGRLLCSCAITGRG